MDAVMGVLNLQERARCRTVSLIHHQRTRGSMTSMYYGTCCNNKHHRLSLDRLLSFFQRCKCCGLYILGLYRILTNKCSSLDVGMDHHPTQFARLNVCGCQCLIYNNNSVYALLSSSARLLQFCTINFNFSKRSLAMFVVCFVNC